MAKWNRRQFLNGLLVANATVATQEALALAAPPPASGGAPPSAVPSVPQVDPGEAPAATSAAPAAGEGAPHDLQRMLPRGLRFGRWRVVEVLPVRLGAVPVILETRRGERFQVDVLRRDGRGHAKRGIAETRHYALYLANTGRGARPTPEDFGLGLMWLAALIRPREHRYRPPALLTLRERLERHPGGQFEAVARTEDAALAAAEVAAAAERSAAPTPEGDPAFPTRAEG